MEFAKRPLLKRNERERREEKKPRGYGPETGRTYGRYLGEFERNKS